MNMLSSVCVCVFRLYLYRLSLTLSLSLLTLGVRVMISLSYLLLLLTFCPHLSVPFHSIPSLPPRLTTPLFFRINLSSSSGRSFRIAPSFQPLLLSHAASGVAINFLGNTPLGRAQRLLSFVHSHKAVLNLIVRARPAVLEGSLTALVRVTQLRSYLGFDAKRKYFFSQLHKMRPERGRRSVHLQLRRGERQQHTVLLRSQDRMDP